jgi:hypothetical protein
MFQLFVRRSALHQTYSILFTKSSLHFTGIEPPALFPRHHCHPHKDQRQRAQDGEDGIPESLFVAQSLQPRGDMCQRRRAQHEEQVENAIGGESRSAKAADEEDDETQQDLQIHQAAQAGSQAAVHAFEGTVHQPADCKFENCQHGYSDDKQGQEGMEGEKDVHEMLL